MAQLGDDCQTRIRSSEPWCAHRQDWKVRTYSPGLRRWQTLRICTPCMADVLNRRFEIGRVTYLVCNAQAGEYAHWRCQKERLHRGPHRFNNYTWGRLPRVWHVRELARWAAVWVKWRRRYGWSGDKSRPFIPWRKVLWPADYDPIPTRPLPARGDDEAYNPTLGRKVVDANGLE